MRAAPLLMAALVSAGAAAATAYVSDELILGVYADPNGQGQRLATLHSGAGVETLAANGEFTQVRLNDGTTGWVKSTYLTTVVPATVRVRQLEEELERTRATTPDVAEAAAHNEVLELRHELETARSELAARTSASAPVAAPVRASRAPSWAVALAVIVAAGGGYWLGYAALARRVRRKFGGLKVY